MPEKQSLSFTVFGHHPDTVGDSGGGVCRIARPAVNAHASLGARVGAEEQASDFGSPGAHQTGHADHFARVDLKGDRAGRTACQIPDFQQYLAGRTRLVLIEIDDLPADHHADDIGG